MSKKNILLKFKLVLFGVFLGILFLELLLQAFALFTIHLTHPKPSAITNSALRIVCLGDSFTYGLGASTENSYPVYLEKLFNQNTLAATVINKGLPGLNSSKLANNLDDILKKYNPNIALIMIGVNDCWNFEGVEEKNLNPKNFFYKSKTYKLIKLIYVNIRPSEEKALYSDRLFTEKSYAHLILLVDHHIARNNFSKAKSYAHKSIFLSPELASGYISLSRCYKAQEHNRQALSSLIASINYINSDQTMLIHKELIELSRYYRERKEYALCLEALLLARCLNCSNNVFYSEIDFLFEKSKDLVMAIKTYSMLADIFPEDEKILLRLGKIYQALQDFKNSKKYFLKTIEISPQQEEALAGIENADFFIHQGKTKDFNITPYALNKNLLLAYKKNAFESSMQKQYFYSELFKKKTKISDLMESIYVNNLRRIYLTCKKYNVQPVFIGYPSYTPARLEAFCKKHAVPLITLENKFRKVLETKTRTEYFIADGHCTKKGYKLIAQITYKAILKNMLPY